MPIKVARSDQACAFINASVAAGVHTYLFEAQKAMGSGFDAHYTPRQTVVEVYRKLYEKYQKLGRFIEKS